MFEKLQHDVLFISVYVGEIEWDYMNWILVAKGRGHLWALANTVINFKVP
jgi:hypothetical protein